MPAPGRAISGPMPCCDALHAALAANHSTITMHSFYSVPALMGGLLIGLASVLLLALLGHIAGVGGILGAAFTRRPSGQLWRWMFLLGLLVGAAGHAAVAGTGAVMAVRTGFPAPLLVLAGLLIGFGASLANGCTSGHGVCGLGRRSARSLLATLIFLLAAMVATYGVRHVAGVAP